MSQENTTQRGILDVESVLSVREDSELQAAIASEILRFQTTPTGDEASSILKANEISSKRGQANDGV